jgi:hypothetical protein
MSMSPSRDCIHSSCSGHSSSPSRDQLDCPFHRCSEAVCRVVDRWMASIFAANHAKRRLVPSRRIDWGDQIYRGSAAGAPSAWTWLACAILLRAPFGRSEGNAGCPSVPENFMKNLIRRGRPPWPDDTEEALRAQYEALRRQTVLSPSRRWSSRSRLLFKLSVIIALALVWFLYAFLSRHF